MLISNICFFIDCTRILKERYEGATEKQKNQLVTFLKTWLWYNSSSKSIFWRGFTTEAGKIDRVKEHWFSNLSTAKNMMNNGIWDYNRKEQVLWVFERMQWNYTSREENRRLIRSQDYGNFYGELGGNPYKLYEDNGLRIIEEKSVDLLPKLRTFLRARSHSRTIYAEIGFEGNTNRKFKSGLSYAQNGLGVRIEEVMISNKGWLVSTEGMSDMFKVLMSGFWAYMNRGTQDDFLRTYGYSEDRGPYRLVDNFATQQHRVFATNTGHRNIYMTTYNRSDYKRSLLYKLAEYLGITLVFFDADLKLIETNAE